MLNTGLLAVASWRTWRWQQVVCLAATVILLWGWSLTGYKAEFRLLTLGFATLYYTLFTFAYLLPDLLRRQRINEWSLAQFLLASLLCLPVGYGLSREAWGNYPGAFPALAGAAYLLVSWRMQDIAAAVTFFTLGLVCAIAAIAVQFQPSVQVVLYSMIASGLIIGGGGALHAAPAVWIRRRAGVWRGDCALDGLDGADSRAVCCPERAWRCMAGVVVGGGASLYALHRNLRDAPSSPLDGLFPRVVLALMGAVWWR